MAVYEEIKTAVLELPFEARAKLLEEILNSLESSQGKLMQLGVLRSNVG